jgi:diguanylate cyclase (GGDEF)-like protein/PAS domain S-box-containing protein
MKTFNTYYTTQNEFIEFIHSHRIIDNNKILIQIFTALTDEKEISLLLHEITSFLPSASIIGSTTDGEICSGKVSTGKSVISLTQFEKTELKTVLVENCTNSRQAGQELATVLATPLTKLIITFTDGLNCNGEDYLQGISSVNKDVTIAGGLAGDNAKFETTYVFTKNKISSNGAVGAALINRDLNIYTNYSFNWLSVGKNMKITRVDKNRVYSIDNISAYNIYKKYLGNDVAKHLPSLGVEFPLIIQKEDGPIARAVLATHEDGSLSFGGDFRCGDIVNFGYGDAEMILSHSIEAQYDLRDKPVESIFIYSCMARRRFMPNLIENEIKPFQKIANVAGFFTYSEFFSYPSKNELLNQTMTLLGISESQNIGTKDIEIDTQTAALNEYQRSIKALSYLLNITTNELAEENRSLEEKTKIIQAKSESLSQAQAVGHMGSWEIDLITQRATWSEESYHIYKVDPASTSTTLDTFVSKVIEEDQPKVAQAMQSLQDGKIKSLELRVRRTDGVIITVLLSGKMLFDDKGQAVKLIGTTLDITEQVKLREKNKELADIIEHSSNEIYIVLIESYKYLYVNKEALNKLGYTLNEMQDMTLLDINKEFSLEKLKALKEKLLQKGSIFNRTIHTKKDGTKYPVQSYVQYKKFNNQDVAVIFDIDVTDLVTAESKQKRQAEILEQIHDSVISTDMNDIITHWNHGATIIHGYSKEEVIGKSINILYLPEDLKKLQWIRQQALVHNAFHDQVRKVTKSGDIIYTDISLSVFKDETGNVIGITRYSQDITHKKEIEDKLKEQTALLNFQAFHDTLTKLPNRALFDDRLQQSISNAHRHNEKFGLLFIDLDNFKQINDTLGHHYGDEVLKHIAKRLSACIREEDTLSRLGGDEFTILVQNLQTSESAAKIAQKIIDAMKPKLVVEAHELHISASIGISLYPKDSILKHDLLKYADTAMYKAKEEGRNNFQFYSEDMTQLAFEKAVMETSLRKAIEEKQLIVYYQPQIDARDNSIIGLEALVRWRHPEMGLVMPDNFISLAEESGLIKELDNFVMHQAMTDVSQWYKDGLNPGILSLNLSIKQLMNTDFIEIVQKTIRKTDFNIKWLELEITESQMMLDPMKSIEILQTLSSMGIEIAIDDFGTGYSSLAYLKRLPVNKLKIDQSFIQDLPYDDEDRAISKAVIALAQSLNLNIIAEGVENSEQVKYLLSNNCYYIQGYYYSKAITKDEMTNYLKNNKVIPSLH